MESKLAHHWGSKGEQLEGVGVGAGDSEEETCVLADRDFLSPVVKFIVFGFIVYSL